MTAVPGDPGEPGEPPTLQDPLAESMRVVDLADKQGLLVRLMGGASPGTGDVGGSPVLLPVCQRDVAAQPDGRGGP